MAVLHRIPSMKLRLVVAASCATAAMLGGVPQIHAQWNANPSLNTPVCTSAGHQRSQAMISDGAGGAIIVWEDLRTGSGDIYAQRLSAAGVPLWGASGTPVCTAPGVQQSPDLISTANGSVIVVWQDGRDTDWDIYALRLDSNGVAQWQFNGVPVCSVTWQQVWPHLTSDGADGAIVVWQDSRNLGFDVYAQRVNAEGVRLWASNGLPVCSIEHTHLLPQITSDGRGGAIVAWEEGRSFVSQGDIYAQRVGPAGQVLWPAPGVAICTAFNTQRTPRIASDGMGGAIIAWQDQRSGTNGADVFAQRVDSTGTPRWTVNGTPVCTTAGVQSPPRLVCEPGAGAWLCWTDERGTNPHAFAQWLASDGSPRWTVNGVNLSPLSAGAASVVGARDAAHGFIVAWSESRPGGDADIHLQHVDSTGQILHGFNGVVVSNAAAAQTDPCILPDASGGAIVAWTDRRSELNGADIFAARIGPGGLIPIALSAFTATRGDGCVSLRWRTETETSNAGFVLERATNDAWERRAVIPGAGTSLQPRTYEWRDVIEPGQEEHPLRYRLTQIDYSGVPTIAGTLLVPADAVPGSLRITGLWPEPAITDVTVSFVADRDASVRLRVYDAAGHCLVDQEAASAPGAHAMRIGVDRLSAGLHMIELRDDVHSIVRPIVITR